MVSKSKEKEVSESTELAVPDYLKQYQGVPSADSEALAGISSKIPRVSLRGRKFRLIVEGEEIIKPSDELEVVILAVEPEKGRMVKTFYIKGYTSGDSEPPTCSSVDGKYPDAWISDPQHTNCAQCPKNAFGSATSQAGKPSKACKDSKRLYVAIPETKANSGLGLGIGGTVFTLGIPVTSLNSLSEFGKTIAKNGYPLPAVIVSLEMVDSEYPQVEFKFKGFLDQENGQLAIERNIARDFISAVPSGPLLEDKTSKPASLAESVRKLPDQNEKPGNVDKAVGDW